MQRLFVRVHLELTGLWLLLSSLNILNLVLVSHAHGLFFFKWRLFNFTVVNKERASFLLFNQENWLASSNLIQNLFLDKL